MRALCRWLAVDDEMIVEHARVGGPGAGTGRPGRRRPETAGRAGDPPPGHQRLPPEGGRHPGLPVGAVAAPRPRLVRRADRQLPPGRRGLRPRAGRSAGSVSSGSRAACSCPGPALVRRIRDTARRIGADLVVLDPVVPPRSHRSPARHPLRRDAPRCRGGHPRSAARWPPAGGPRAARTASWPSRPAAIRLPRHAGPCAGGPRVPPVVEIPPGSTSTGSDRSSPDERASARAEFGLPADGPLVVSVSRLVPRKGMDVLIDAAVRLRADVPDLTVAIAGRGRDADRLAGRIAEYGAPVRLLGGVSDAGLPALIGAADVFAMLCRNRWLGSRTGGVRHRLPRGGRGRGAPGGRRIGWGRRGGGRRGDRPGGQASDRCGHRGPCHRPSARRRRPPPARWATASRRRAEASFDYDKLAPRLAASLADVAG